MCRKQTEGGGKREVLKSKIIFSLWRAIVSPLDQVAYACAPAVQYAVHSCY